MSLSHDTKIFVSTLNGRERFWLKGANNAINPATGRLALMGDWGPANLAKSMTLETALIARQRFLQDTNCPVDFSLSAGSLDFIEPENIAKSGEPDVRVPMSYRGLLAVPGHDVKSDGQKCWFVRIYENGMQRDSVRGATVQEVVDNVYERNLQALAEKSSIQPQVSQAVAAPARPAGPRIRPGSIRK